MKMVGTCDKLPARRSTFKIGGKVMVILLLGLLLATSYYMKAGPSSWRSAWGSFPSSPVTRHVAVSGLPRQHPRAEGKPCCDLVHLSMAGEVNDHLYRMLQI
jgi:hypothetical protein